MDSALIPNPKAIAGWEQDVGNASSSGTKIGIEMEPFAQGSVSEGLYFAAAPYADPITVFVTY